VGVRSTSTIEVRSVTYSVPSRLIRHQLRVHLCHDRLDLFLRIQFIETLLQLHRRKEEKGALRRIRRPRSWSTASMWRRVVRIWLECSATWNASSARGS
ncbi:MAG: hypothetical protein WBM08_14650, partial [Prochlorococcaceae cyanobacterium]